MTSSNSPTGGAAPTGTEPTGTEPTGTEPTPTKPTPTGTKPTPAGSAVAVGQPPPGWPIAPVEPPPWIRVDLASPITGGLVLLAVGIGLVGDLAVRSGLVGLAGALLVVATSAALLVSGRLRTRQSMVLVALAPLFGGWLALRSSAWLLPLDLVAAFGLLVAGTSLSSGGSVTNLSLANLVARAWHAGLQAFAVPGSLVRLAGGHRKRNGNSVTWAVVRGMLLATPVVLLLGVLLASADAVFASMVSFEFNGGVAVEHVFVVVAAAWVFLALLRVASAVAPAALPAPKARLGAVEALVVLASVIVLFGGFAVTQAVAVVGGEQYVQQTTGLTYAEYARSGFFQLLWVAALTVGGVLALRAATDRREPRSARRFTVLSCLVCGLTVLIVAVAVRRLALYSEAYGLTMLRLYCTIFAVWIGVVLVLLIAWLAGLGRGRAWFAPAAAACGLALLFGLNVANPEAYVARTNLERQAVVELDTEYLTGDLSDDAVPTIVERLPSLEAGTREDIHDELCADRRPSGYTGWAAWNLSQQTAKDQRASVCNR